jgi:hypothetical protein
VCYKEIQSKDVIKKNKIKIKIITIKKELTDNMKSMQVRTWDILGRDAY